MRHGSERALRHPIDGDVGTHREIEIRKFTVGLVGAAAIVTGLVLLKQKREEPEVAQVDVPAGETAPRALTLERIRELGV